MKFFQIRLRYPIQIYKNAIILAPDDQSLLFLADLVILHVLISYIMTRSVMELILSLQMMNNHEKPWGKNWIPKSDLKMPYFQPQMTNLRDFFG